MAIREVLKGIGGGGGGSQTRSTKWSIII